MVLASLYICPLLRRCADKHVAGLRTASTIWFVGAREGVGNSRRRHEAVKAAAIPHTIETIARRGVVIITK